MIENPEITIRSSEPALLPNFVKKWLSPFSFYTHLFTLFLSLHNVRLMTR